MLARMLEITIRFGSETKKRKQINDESMEQVNTIRQQTNDRTEIETRMNGNVNVSWACWSGTHNMC